LNGHILFYIIYIYKNVDSGGTVSVNSKVKRQTTTTTTKLRLFGKGVRTAPLVDTVYLYATTDTGDQSMVIIKKLTYSYLKSKNCITDSMN
jgi:hypothetical protein